MENYSWWIFSLLLFVVKRILAIFIDGHITTSKLTVESAYQQINEFLMTATTPPLLFGVVWIHLWDQNWANWRKSRTKLCKFLQIQSFSKKKKNGIQFVDSALEASFPLELFAYLQYCYFIVEHLLAVINA